MIAEPGPLLFLDTAAILNISRVVYRPEIRVDLMESAMTIVDELAASPKKLWVVTTANVEQEFNNNREQVKQELNSEMAALSKSILRLSQLARRLAPERRITTLDWLDLTLQKRVVGVMDRLIASMIIFEGTTQGFVRAKARSPGRTCSRNQIEEE